MIDFTQIGVLDWVLLGIIGALFLYQLYFYIRYMAGVQRRVRHQSKGRFRWKKKARVDAEETTDEPEVKGVSVVVCAKNEGENLQDYLQALLGQNYPLFEVIVVNDASEDNTQLVLEHYMQRYPRLHLTFVPANAWVRSTKKLALTLAAKAAKYDYLLLTDADCCPESPNWITEMMHGFDNPETEVVLGYGGYFEEPTRVSRRISYDTIFCAMQWMGMAMSRHPYMGVGRNLAYKKSMFFESGGFSGMLNQRAGDDDLFVNKVSSFRNTEVVLTPGSYTWSIPKHTFEEWRVQKYRHLSVAPSYRFGTKFLLTVEPVTRGLFYLMLIAVAVLCGMGLVHWAIGALAGVLFLVRLTWQMCMITRAAHIFGVHGFGLITLWYDIWLPVNNLIMLCRHAVSKHQEMRW